MTPSVESSSLWAVLARFFRHMFTAVIRLFKEGMRTRVRTGDGEQLE